MLDREHIVMLKKGQCLHVLFSLTLKNKRLEAFVLAKSGAVGRRPQISNFISFRLFAFTTPSGIGRLVDKGIRNGLFLIRNKTI